MRLRADQLLPPQHSRYYFYGDDHDAIFEAADALLAAGSDAEGVICMRLDVSELARFEEASKNLGLFGPSPCYALVRNAQSATPKQGEHLKKLLASDLSEHRLIVCAPGVDWKKALHKQLKADPTLPQCEFHLPDEAGFARWLEREVAASGLQMAPDTVTWMAERLCGMRLAARQLIERLKWYDNGAGEPLGLDVVGELLGERAPGALEDWCHATAMRQPEAVHLCVRLLNEQQVAEVQMVSWLGTRLQQLLMYLWFQAKRDRNPLMAAKVFGEARQKVPAEAACWRGSELREALAEVVRAEKLVKGASIEEKRTVIEGLTRRLVAGAA